MQIVTCGDFGNCGLWRKKYKSIQCVCSRSCSKFWLSILRFFVVNIAVISVLLFLWYFSLEYLFVVSVGCSPLWWISAYFVDTLDEHYTHVCSKMLFSPFYGHFLVFLSFDSNGFSLWWLKQGIEHHPRQLLLETFLRLSGTDSLQIDGSFCEEGPEEGPAAFHVIVIRSS